MIQTLALNLNPTTPAPFAPRQRSAGFEISFADTLGRLEHGTPRTERIAERPESRAVEPASRQVEDADAKRSEAVDADKPHPSQQDDQSQSEAVTAEEQPKDPGAEAGGQDASPTEAVADSSDAEEASTAPETEDDAAEPVIDEALLGEVAEPAAVLACEEVAASAQAGVEPGAAQAVVSETPQGKTAQLKPQQVQGEGKSDPATPQAVRPDPALTVQAGSSGHESQTDTGDAPQDDGGPAAQAAPVPTIGGDKSASPAPASLVQTNTSVTPTDAGNPGGTPLPQGMMPVAGQALPTATAESNSADDGSQSINEARLARGLANAINQRGGSLTLRLTPPEIGTVRIQMQLGNGTVNAQFHAETPTAHTLLTQQLADLRSVLEGHGLTVEKLTVQPMNQGQFSGQAGNQDDSSSSNDGRSRGQYTRDDGSSRRDRQQQQDRPQSFDQWFSRQAVALNEGV